MKKIIVLMLVSIFYVGCKSYTVDLNTYSTNNYPGTIPVKFLLGSADQNISTGDLQFQEFANYTVKALKESGYEFADSNKEADLGILISYSISEPYTYTTEHSYDTYGYKAPETYNYSGNTSYYSGNTYKGSGNTTGTITTQGGYGKTGTQTYSKLHTMYGVRFIISAYDYKAYEKSKAAVPVWTTELSMVSEVGKLREAIPIMLYKAKGQIGKKDIKSLKLSYNPTSEGGELEKFVK